MSLTCLCGLVCSFIVSVSPLAAQVRDVESAQRLANVAVDLAKDGRGREAVVRIRRQMNDRQPPKVKARLLFTLGWLHQQMANDAKGDARTSQLEEAKRRYEELVALPGFDSHRQTSDNLATVLRQLGDTAGAAEVLTQGARTRTGDKYEFHLRLGDLKAGELNVSGALRHYQNALGVLPGGADAAQRIAFIVPKLDPQRHRLYAICEDLVEYHPSAALRGFQSLLRRRNAPREARVRAMVRWVELSGQGRTLTPSSFSRLVGAPSPVGDAMKELVEFAKSPVDAVRNESNGFWLNGNDRTRKHVLSLALYSFGKHHELTGNFDKAEKTYQTGIRRVSPEPGSYVDGSDLSGKPIVRLTLALALATLYHTQPELDPRQVKFQRLEEQLLSQKNMAYGARDLNAMQQFHTYFGMMYADRKKWKSAAGRLDDRNWRTAPYHLRRAVEVTQEKAGRTGDEFQPLPHLSQLHAEGLRDNGGSRNAVRQLYVNAARGFLDIDDVDRSAMALDKAVESQGRVLDEEEALNTIVAVRKEVMVSVDVQQMAVDARNEWIQNTVDRVKTNQSSLDASFLRRQRAKVFSAFGDKVRKASEDSEEEVRRYLNQSLDELKAATIVPANDIRVILDSPAVDANPKLFDKRFPELRSKGSNAALLDRDKLDELKLNDFRSLNRSP